MRKSRAYGFRTKPAFFTTELVALNLALDIVWRPRNKNVVIFSASLSCLLTFHNLQAESGYVMKFLENCTALVNTGKTILLWRVPGHVGIRGNEQANDVAKMAINSSISAVKYPPSDLYHDVTSLCYKLWQADWVQRTGNTLHSVKPLLGSCPLSCLSCGDAIVLQRLCVGHTRLSHSLLLSRADQPLCCSCDCALTVVRLLLECPLCTTVRGKYFSVSSMEELFHTIKASNILPFIQEIGFYHHI